MIEVIITTIKPPEGYYPEAIVLVTKITFQTSDEYEEWLQGARHYLGTIETLTEA